MKAHSPYLDHGARMFSASISSTDLPFADAARMELAESFTIFRYALSSSISIGRPWPGMNMVSSGRMPIMVSRISRYGSSFPAGIPGKASESTRLPVQTTPDSTNQISMSLSEWVPVAGMTLISSPLKCIE